MKTTVIIPNYNGKAYLQDCLESLALCGGTFAVLVVDNGSTDGSVEMLRRQFSDIGLLELPENTGFCHAVNVGIRAAGTPYVFLLNNDTTVEKETVRRLEEVMEERGNCFSVAARMLSMQEPDKLDGAGDLYCALGWAFARGKGKAADTYPKMERVFSACGGAALYRREAVLSLGGFDEAHFAYLEDLDLGWRAAINGFVNLYQPEAVVYHAGSGFSGSRYNDFKVRLSSRNSVYVIYKNMPFLQILLNLPFLLLGFLIKILFFIRKGYGMIYIKGLCNGFKMCRTGANRRKKVPFCRKNLPCYARIQLDLWQNMIHRIVG